MPIVEKEYSQTAYALGQQFNAQIPKISTDRSQRALLLSQLHALLNRSEQENFAIFLIKIDNFIDVEQDFGFELGCTLISEIGAQLKLQINNQDCLVHLQSDEFALLKTDISDAESAKRLATKIQSRFRFSFQIETYNILCSCHIGISLQTEMNRHVNQILKDADIALKIAEKKGRGQFHIAATKPILATNTNMVDQQQRLARALTAGVISPHYQPIIHLNTNRLIGFEVLPHWNSDNETDDTKNFMHLAERTDIIISLDLQIIKQACLQLKQWQCSSIDNQQLILTMNLSVKHLILDGAVEHLIFIIQQQQICPSSLIFEFREQDFIAQNDFVINSLKKLRAVGIQLGLDDFGKGFGSLNAFFKYPIDYIKIDQSFTNRMLMSKKDLSLIRVIRDISHDMGLHVIVEGIDNPQQHTKLIELGCEYGLGNYIASPMNHVQVNRLLEL